MALRYFSLLTATGLTKIAPVASSSKSTCVSILANGRPGRAAPRSRGAKVMIGGVPARQEKTTGTINGTRFTNITIRFSFAHGQEVDAGTVQLVTPTRDIGKNRPTFNAFLAQMKFDQQ